MRAVTGSEYGGTPVVGEIPTPEPGAGQVLLRMRAAGMNPMDRTLASGAWRPAPATFPMVLGADGAGVVERAGEGGEEIFPRRRAVRPVADRPARCLAVRLAGQGEHESVGQGASGHAEEHAPFPRVGGGGDGD